MDNSKLIYENYVFNLDKRYDGNNNEVKRYTCSAKSTRYNCRIVAWVSDDGTVTLKGGRDNRHEHPFPSKHHRALAIAEIRQKACSTDALPSEIVNNVFRSNRDAALHLRSEAAKKHVHRARRLYQPPLPQTFQQLDTVFSNYPKIANIYHGFIKGTDDSIGYIFGSNLMIDHLKDVREIHIDGTFQSVPDKPRAEQLIIILMRHGCIGIPILFILTDRKTTAIYCEIWNWLITRLPTLSMSLKVVISDYEVGLVTSIEKKLPRAQHRGCWFHFCRAVTKKWHQLALPESGEKCYPLHLAWALPLLPSNYFEDAIDYIDGVSGDLQHQNCKYTDFILYLKRQWEPKSESVSVFGSGWRTNNIAEEFNRHLVNKMDGKHPPLYKFLARLINIIDDSEIQYTKIISGIEKQVHSHPLQYAIDSYINNIQNALRAGRLKLSEFLWAAVERNNIKREYRQHGS